VDGPVRRATVLSSPEESKNPSGVEAGGNSILGMAARITELVFDSRDPERLARFWCDVLGYVELDRGEEGDIEIGPPGSSFGGPHPTLVFVPNDEPKQGKLRLHIDINATDRDQDAELERLLSIGAVQVDIGQTGEESWYVLADPEGNEFCLLRRRVDPIF